MVGAELKTKCVIGGCDLNGMNAALMQSFAENRGKRGVHFYGQMGSEFVPWNEALSKVEKLPEKFSDKLIEAMANYNPENEFVTVTASSGSLTIELFKMS